MKKINLSPRKWSLITDHDIIVEILTDYYSPVRKVFLCNNCGRGNNIQLHHKTFKSHTDEDTLIEGPYGNSYYRDSPWNLIPLCNKCHLIIAHGDKKLASELGYRWGFTKPQK